MKKFISGLLLLVAAGAWAMETEEEAVILNQELQYLKESAKIPAVSTEETTQVLSEKSSAPQRSRNLEATYFGDEEDMISTKSAGRRRRADD